jgi:DNA-binding IclR family transcriptional regulator
MIHRTLKLSSIEKALAILMAFNGHLNHEMGTVELSEKLNFHPATVSRILQILAQKGFLQINQRTRKFSLGPSTFELGRTLFQSFNGNLLNIAIPYLVDLRGEVGETVVFETMSGNDPVVTYIAQGKHSLSVKPNIGDRVPFHVSAGAKAIMAFSKPEMIDKLLARAMEILTPHTITDKERLKHQLKQIRKRGVAFFRGVNIVGAQPVGVPIFDHEGKPIAAVVVVGLASRLKCAPDSSVAVALKRTARDISAQLFHPESVAGSRTKEESTHV